MAGPATFARPSRGDELELTIDSLAHGGNGVARLEGYVVFVAGAVPGDRVRRGDAPPIIDHGFLHPLEVHGIVHMTHVIDVAGFDGDAVAERGHADEGLICLHICQQQPACG